MIPRETFVWGPRSKPIPTDDCIVDEEWAPTREEVELALVQLKAYNRAGYGNHVLQGTPFSFDEQGPQPVNLPGPIPYLPKVQLPKPSPEREFYLTSFRGEPGPVHHLDPWHTKHKLERDLARFLTYPLGVFILNQLWPLWRGWSGPRSKPEPGPVTWTYLDLETG